MCGIEVLGESTAVEPEFAYDWVNYISLAVIAGFCFFVVIIIIVIIVI